MMLKLALMVALLRAFINKARPLRYAGIWTAAVLILGYTAEGQLTVWIVAKTCAAFLLSLGYFTLLEFLDGKFFWFIVAPVGVVFLAVLG